MDKPDVVLFRSDTSTLSTSIVPPDSATSRKHNAESKILENLIFLETIDSSLRMNNGVSGELFNVQIISRTFVDVASEEEHQSNVLVLLQTVSGESFEARDGIYYDTMFSYLVVFDSEETGNLVDVFKLPTANSTYSVHESTTAREILLNTHVAAVIIQFSHKEDFDDNISHFYNDLVFVLRDRKVETLLEFHSETNTSVSDTSTVTDARTIELSVGEPDGSRFSPIIAQSFKVRISAEQDEEVSEIQKFVWNGENYKLSEK